MGEAELGLEERREEVVHQLEAMGEGRFSISREEWDERWAEWKEEDREWRRRWMQME